MPKELLLVLEGELGVEAFIAEACYPEGPRSIHRGHCCPSWAVRGVVGEVVAIEFAFGSARGFQLFAYSAVWAVPAYTVRLEPPRDVAVVRAGRHVLLDTMPSAWFSHFGGKMGDSVSFTLDR